VSVRVAAASVCVLAVSIAPVARAGSLPRIEQQRIVAEFGRTYLPGTMPASYIYIRWEAQPGSADVFGYRLLVWFGKHGRVVQWHVEDSRDGETLSYQDCGRHHPFGKTFRVAGRTVYYAGGAVGQEATLCLPDHYAVVVWNDYSLSRATLVKIAASAHAVG
jgi:hypothetical protein